MHEVQIQPIVSLTPIEETALPTLWCRAHYFRNYTSTPDVYAEKILSDLEYVSADSHAAQDPITLYRILHLGNRAARIDQLTREFLNAYPEALVVNAGCGLETFFQRIDNGRMRGLSLDQKNIVELRAQLRFPETDRFEEKTCENLCDGQWLQDLDASRGLLIVLAGVSMYLSEAELQAMLLNIRSLQPGAQVLLDYHSPIGVALANATISRSAHAKVYFRSGWTVSKLRRCCPGLKGLSNEDLGDLTQLKIPLSSVVSLLSKLARLLCFSRLVQFCLAEKKSP